MTINELIEHLSKLDGNAIVRVTLNAENKKPARSNELICVVDDGTLVFARNDSIVLL